MEYITDKIGEEYKEWRSGNRIYISAPTGSGKTTFILQKLLPYAAENGRKILYLVNRKALKAQIQKEIDSIDGKYISEGYRGVREVIKITTYQKLEADIKSGICRLEGYYYVVCDESHYFLNDALFNTNTAISFGHITQVRNEQGAIVIYISATIDRFKRVTERMFTQDGSNRGNELSEQMHALANNFIKSEWVYSGIRNYDYCVPHFFSEISELINIIKKSKEKWLVFYNDIVEGKKLEEQLNKGIHGEKEAIFIDAEYYKQKDSTAAVDSLVEQRSMKHRIIVSTATLDNGISIEDEGLRNVAIIADGEIEFVQMLGRKRRDGKQVHIYLGEHSQGEFQKRYNKLSMLSKRLNEAKDYILRNNHYGLSEKILMDAEFAEQAKKFLYQVPHKGPSFGGYIYLYSHFVINRFSEAEIEYKKVFYEQQIEKLKSDSKAYLKEQLGWLGFSADTIDNMVSEDIEAQIENLQDKLSEALEEKLGHELSQEDNKKFKEQIKDELRRLLELVQEVPDSGIDSALSKNDRGFGTETFNRCMEICQLPYCMEGGRKKPFVIRKIEE